MYWGEFMNDDDRALIRADVHEVIAGVVSGLLVGVIIYFTLN